MGLEASRRSDLLMNKPQIVQKFRLNKKPNDRMLILTLSKICKCLENARLAEITRMTFIPAYRDFRNMSSPAEVVLSHATIALPFFILVKTKMCRSVWKWKTNRIPKLTTRNPNLLFEQKHSSYFYLEFQNIHTVIGFLPLPLMHYVCLLYH